MTIKEVTIGNIWIIDGSDDSHYCMIELQQKESELCLPMYLNRAQCNVLIGELQVQSDKEVINDFFRANPEVTDSRVKSITINKDNSIYSASVLFDGDNGCRKYQLPAGEGLTLAHRFEAPILVEEELFDHIKTVLRANGLI